MRAWAYIAMAAAAASACVSSSIGGDVERVEALTELDDLARVTDDVDPSTDGDARELLGEPLDVERAVRIALLNNRELRATLREMGVARGQLMQAGLLPNPIVEVELLPERQTQVELRVEWDVTSVLLAPVHANAMAPELEAARYRTAGEVIDLGYRVRAGFYALQAAEQSVAIAERMLDAAVVARDAARAMHEAGNLPELVLAAEEATYEKARIAVAELELAAATERERMQRLLGLHGEETEWRIAAALPPAAEEARVPEDLETRALRASLELRAMREHIDGLARQAGYTRAEGWLPDVDLDVHGLYGDPEETSGVDPEWRFGAGISVGVPLFDRNQGTATAIDAELDATVERYHGVAIDLRSAARDARNRVVSSHARALQYQNVIVPAQRRVTDQTVLQYNAMQIGIYDVLAARREQLDVELAYVETLREHFTALAELDALLAGQRVSVEMRERSGGMGPAARSGGGH